MNPSWKSLTDCKKSDPRKTVQIFYSLSADSEKPCTRKEIFQKCLLSDDTEGNSVQIFEHSIGQPALVGYLGIYTVSAGRCGFTVNEFPSLAKYITLEEAFDVGWEHILVSFASKRYGMRLAAERAANQVPLYHPRASRGSFLENDATSPRKMDSVTFLQE